MKIILENGLEKDCILNGEIQLKNSKIDFYIVKANLKRHFEVLFFMDMEIQNITVEKSILFDNSYLFDVMECLETLKDGKMENIVPKLEKVYLSFKNIDFLTLNDFETICNTLNFTLPKREIEVYYNGYSEMYRNDNYFSVDIVLVESVNYFILNKIVNYDFSVATGFQNIELLCKCFVNSFLGAYDECYKDYKKSELFEEVYNTD